ncbi:hypothetical protein AGABI2DRAFT_118673 [Agaricus bisporus var. bisporus H97]|uniref:hypothetical protein n=1 Tax=Agaricus bisporus var. bisporus (strain H97 / ATCC MYA-4626 / FGSC 10389) TaxID=936046 RepID=UPI00029F4FA5|nr:hypothetical protein AGABI2DRAFT_118673 [Agaricus bisporus var. bisporus H97]EKV46496.1 hypothetical protein AGABI2DRAFT_118673 [Agaricus bisporus var. bisporus H97]
MGFLKRIFSIGSKKNRKQSSSKPLPATVEEEQRRELEEEEHEAAVGRLLRSSSSRYAVVKEIDYTDLPPLPHPINDVLAQCMPKEQTPSLRASPSTLSLASSTLSRHSTFSVTLHGRQRHAMTEFPNANGELGDGSPTPVKSKSTRDGANLAVGHPLGLRSDPSVASLIDLYDEHGRLPVETFSNSPPSGKQERPQKKRNGSTLRELLGAPDSLRSKVDTNLESDISWAERFLDEADSISSNNTSSYGPHTPSTHSDFGHDRGQSSKTHDFTFSTISTNNVDDLAINSMEVELSSTSDTNPIAKGTNPYKNVDPSTPQRASQVFSFLTGRRNNGQVETNSRSTFKFSSIVSHDNLDSHFSSGFTSPSPRKSQANQSLFSDPCETPRQMDVAITENADDTTPGPRKRKVRVLMTGPTKVIVTAPTPDAHATSSRIPVRGPRPPPQKRSSRRTPALTHSTNSSNSATSRRSRRFNGPTSIPQRRTSRQSSSEGSTKLSKSIAEADAMATVLALDQLARNKPPRTNSNRGDKENQLGLTAKTELPATPSRNHASRSSLLRKPIAPAVFQSPRKAMPSPSSSSELSPVGKQMMVDARSRKRTREYEQEVRRPIGVRI